MRDGLSHSTFKPDNDGRYTIEGEFFDEDELREAGYVKVDDFGSVKITEVNAAEYCHHAKSLIDDGAKVITVYKSLSILGNEGYVSMWSTKNKRAKK